MTTEIERLYVLLCGYEFQPQSVSFRGGDERFILSLPICTYVLKTRTGWILLDTGVNIPRAEARLGALNLMTPVVRRRHEIDPQLAAIGIGFADIDHVIISHLHLDHSGYLDHLTHARISMQRREYDYAFGDADDFYIRADYDLPDLQWDLHDGDWQACEGLELIATRGHTEGHQSAIVTLPGQTIVLPFDAGDFARNFSEEILPGYTVDDADAHASIRKLNHITRERNAWMLLFHDPEAIQTTRLAPDYYD